MWWWGCDVGGEVEEGEGMCGVFFFQEEDGIRVLVRSRGLEDVYKKRLGPST